MNKIFIFIFFVFQNVYGAELVELNTSVRALGMGNAYTAIANDTDALFYNPAGIARSEGYSWRILDINGGLNGLDAMSQATDIEGGSEESNPFSEFYGKKVWLGMGAKTGIVVPSFGVAGFGAGYTGLAFRNPAYPMFDVSYYADYGAAIGVAFDFADIFAFGITGKRTIRQGGQMQIEAGDINQQQTGETTMADLLQSKRGTGLGLDAGFLFTVPVPSKPTLSFVWKNVGYTKFIAESGYDAPEFVEDEMIFGAAMDFDLVVLNIRPTLDYKYANRYDIQNGKKLHFGLEFGMPFVEFRAGFYQGYYTLGTTLDLWLLRLDAATWGVEMGEYPGQDQDRRYAVQLTLELSLDPSDFSFLNFTGAKGSSGGRKLKQRR